MSSGLTPLKFETLPPELAELLRQLAVATVEQAVDLIGHWVDTGIPDALPRGLGLDQLTELKSSLQALIPPRETPETSVPPPGWRPMSGVLPPGNRPRHTDVEGSMKLTDEGVAQPEEGEEP